MNDLVKGNLGSYRAGFIKLIPLFGILVSLSGCSSIYSSKFDCPYGEGLGCASVSKVNKMIDANMVDIEDKLPIRISTSSPTTSQSTSPSTSHIPIYFGPNHPIKVMTFNGIPVL